MLCDERRRVQDRHARRTSFRAALDVADLDRSLSVRIDVPGFGCQATRPKERFASLIRGGEERWYRRLEAEVRDQRFVMTDPDGHLLRFFIELGRRRAGASTA